MKVFGEERINTYFSNSQSAPAVAGLTGGGYVVTWASTAQDGSGDGIYAQRLDANGVAVGPEFRVNTTVTNTQTDPAIAGLSDGGFLVVWTDYAADGSSYGVFAQRYNAGAVPQGVEFQINTYTANDQGQASIDSYNGGFVVAWYSNGQDGSGYGVYDQRYDNLGNKVGVETRVNTTTSGHQYEPDVATYANGSYVVVWRSDGQDGSGAGVYAQRFDNAGAPAGTEFRVNTATTGNQVQPHVATLSGGGFVVVWADDSAAAPDGSSYAVYGQLYNSSGVAQGTQFRINESTAGGQYQPNVIGLSTGGFVVSWYNDNYDVGAAGSYQDVYVREYDSAGTALTGQIKGNTPTPAQTTQSEPVLASLGNGDYALVWTSGDGQDGSGNGIYQQLFGNAAHFTRQANPELGDFGGIVNFGENAVNARLQVLDAAVSLVDSDSANFGGGKIELYYVTGGSAEDQLGVVNQGNAPGQIGVAGNTVNYGGTAIGTISGGVNGANLTITLNNNATVHAVERLIEKLGYGNNNSSPTATRELSIRVSDGDGGSAFGGVVTVNVARELDGTPAAYGETQVNTYTANDQADPEVARLSDGGYVVVWTSYLQDGSSYGIYAQRYNASGVAVGPEWQVNSLTDNEQSYAHVAGLSNGGFVITWQDNNGYDGSSWGVFGQRYDANGAAAGSQFLVNTFTGNNQFHDAVVAYSGGFATAWSSNTNPGGNSHDIYLQRWDNAGAKVGGELRVSDIPGTSNPQAGLQYLPDIAALNDGDLVLVWRDDNANDGGSGTYGVFARRFDAATQSFGNTFLVNTGNINGNQYEPKVASLSDGGFVIVWRDDSLDGSSAAVMGQRYDANSAPVGTAFRVNEYTVGGQYQPDVIGLSTGGFVVAFYNDNVGPDGTQDNVYLREYDAAGKPVDGDRLVNTYTNSTQYDPALTDLGNGNYAVVWASYAQDGSTYGIFQQLFGDTAELPRQANPELADFVGTVTFNENLVNAGLQVIDAAVSLTDSDSANFNGGRLDLYYLIGAAAEDQLGVVNQGNGPGQIGVAGNLVSYGGVQIGTISGGVNGANLRIDFTSNAATPDAVEALIQRLGYANPDSSPNPSRTLGLRVSDGDGGSSTPNVLTINVTPQLDGTPLAYGETQVNTYTLSNQTEPQIAVLSDGSYVVVWHSTGQDGSGEGVYAQRHSASGVAVGPEFQVNSVTSAAQDAPHVAALANGGFVVIWDDASGVDGSGQGVIAQIYNGAGVAQGANFVVNTFTSSTQQYSDVAGYAGNGGSVAAGFTAVWASSGNPNGSSYDIYLQRFDNSGGKIGTELRVSNAVGLTTAQSGAQYLPRVASYSNGDLVIVWRDDGANDGGATYGVFGQRYSAATNTLSGTFQVNTFTTGNQYEPDVATLSGGGFVVVWRSDNQDGSSAGVYGQRYDSSGVKTGSEFLINESTTGGQYMPSVTGLSTGGFVVTWYNDNYDVNGAGTTSDAYIREFDATGNAIDGQRKLLSDTNSTEYQPSIADLGNGNYVVVYADYNNLAGSPGVNTYEIVQQILGDTAEMPRQANPDLADFVGTVTFDENLVNAGLQVIDAAVSLTDIDSANFNGGRLDLYYLTGAAAEDQLGVVNQGNGPGQIGVAGNIVSYGGVAIGTISGGVNGANLRIDFTSNAATPDAVEALIQRLGYANPDSSPNASRTLGLRVSDGDGGSSTPNVLTINVTAQLDGTPLAYGETAVNTYTPGNQQEPEVARLNDGGYVVVWQSTGQDGSGDGVYGQRHNASGVAVGPEFQVSTVTANSQNYAHVAGISNGGFVVTWQDNVADGSSYGVYGQRYDAGGTAQGGNFLVNTFTTNQQSDDVVASYTGGFAVVWTSQSNPGGNGFDIFVKRYDNAGAVVTADTLVSTVPGAATPQVGTQVAPDVAAFSNGNLVIVWEDQQGNDGSSYGVYGRTYNAAAGTFSSTFLVNTFTTGAQYEPSVATLADGGFVVVWRSDNQDGSSAGVYAQRYDNAGVKAGSEFLINESTTGGQYMPSVTGLSTGGFVVTWYNDNYDVNGAGTTQDVYVREFDATGNAIDGQRKLLSDTNSTEYQPSISDLGNGNYVVVYADYDTGGTNTYEIVQQIFGDTAELPRQVNPVLDDLRATRIFGAAEAITPQIIDADVQVQDSDSANFDTGSLWVYFTSGSVAADTLAINNQGNSPFQIGVSGNNVSFGGTVIGTFAGGIGGAPLVVTFNAGATPEAARYLVQNISYKYDAGVAPAGTTNRTVAFRLFDGDGGASPPASTAITIQPAAPVAALSLTDLESSVTLAESAAQLGTVLDTAVQLDAGAAGFTGGTLTVTYVSSTGRPEDQLSIRNQGNGANQVGFNAATRDVSFEGTIIGNVAAADNGVNGDQLVVTFNASATAQSIERVIENLNYQTSSDGPLASRTIQVQVKDAANATTAQTMVINISPETDGAQRLFGEDQVNTFTPGDQYYPFVTGLKGPNAGSYVIVWEDRGGADGDGYGIHAQRYNAQGVQVGTEFQVNTYTPANQTEAKVASLADGGFLVVWRSEGQDGSSGGVYAQRYGADGAAAGNEFRVSTVTVNDQTNPKALGLSNGQFIITWADSVRDSSSYGVYAQRYAADGTPIGSDFQVNTYLPNQQQAPYLAELKDDPATGGTNEAGFVVVWESNGQDGSSWGVYAQRFDLAGAKVGGEFKVNTSTTNGQVNPDVAVLDNSHVVVVWHDLSDSSIRGQLYTAGGVSIGGEFTVSTSDYNSDYGQWPHVTSLANGGFVVSWDGVNSPTDSGYGVYGQQFDASGNKVDGPLQLSTNIANTQIYPNLAGLTGGNFVATWMSYNQEPGTANTYGIFQQLYGTPGSIVRQVSPQLIDLEASVSFNENDLNAGARIIDPGVRVFDPDSANFDTGRLVVSVISGYGSLQAFNPAASQQDNFSIRNQGNGATQIGFNAVTGVVTYGGVTIGSIVPGYDGQNGANLVVQFNASATPGAVEALIENLTYRNPSSDPTATRKVSMVVSDGDGGQSVAQTIDIQINAQTDGAVRLLADDQQVNTYVASDQTLPMIAALQGGNSGQYVIVWQSNGQDSDNWGVFAQRYDVNGSAIGPEFQVNTYTPGAQAGQNMVGIGALSTGGFVVAWESQGQDGYGNGIFAQRYDAAGQPVGNEFLVNSVATYEQLQPRVLGLDGGAFVIAYSDQINADGNDYGVRVQHYDASGVAQGAPVTVNTFVTNNQSFPELAKLNDGGYVVTWHSNLQDGDGYGVYARIMNANGTPRSGEFQVNTYTANNQWDADVATLVNGDFVISWLSNNPGLGGWSIMAQRFTAAGVKVGGEVLVNDGNTPSNGDTYTHIAALATGGYVVTWSAYPGVNGHDVYAQQFDASGNKIDAPLRLNNYTSSTQYRPDIAALGGDRFVAAWQSYGQDADPNTYGIYQGLFGPAGSLTRSAAPVITDLVPSVTFLENAANGPSGLLIDPAVSLFDSDSLNFDGGRLTVSVISGYSSLGTDLSQNLPLQDHFSVRNQGGGVGQVGFNAGTGVVSYAGTAIGNIVPGFNGQNGVDLVIQFNPSASAQAVEAVIENLTYRNSSSDPVASRLASIMLTDGDGGSSVPRTVQINVTPEADGGIPLFTAEQVNTYTTSTQSFPAMAKLADGGYVTMWQSSEQDGWGYGIFGQRFASDGTRVGNEFRVSDYTPLNQTEVSAAGLKDGGFVAVYRGQSRDASGDAVIGQRFDVNGVRVGSEFVVNTSTNGNQYQPAITSLADGGFAVAWYSDGVRDGENYDVFFQRYNAAGQAVGVETRANTPIVGQTGAQQWEPNIIQLGSGDIVVAWRSENAQDGSLSGVYAQRFSSAGATIGGEFRLNVYTDDYQYDPHLAPTANGFVAVWTSRGQDGSADGVYARLYDNSGSPVSGEFRVNETSSSYQLEDSVASLANGGFVVTWRDYNGNRIYSQQFDGLGNRIDGETQLDATTSSNQQPVVVGLNNGNFVVSWFGYYDASDSGIFQRIVGNPADFPRQVAPVIVDLTSSVTYLENQVNDAPQLIDPGIGLLDPDSANFAGGRLDVSYVTPYGNPNQFDIPGINAQDQLGIRNQGTGVEQIGVSGNTVTYNFGDGAGAVVIGTIQSDGVNGKALTVLFNDKATPAAAEALIENLTYQNFLSNPEPSRTISLSLSDGDGGVTAPKAITINITAQPDGAVPFGAEKVVNTTTPGTQSNPAIAYLSNGSYVVVWTDENAADGNGSGVFARVYDSSDNPLGLQFQINTTTASTQYEPKVIGLDGGGFTVIWASNAQISPSSSFDIVARQFSNTGTPTSGQIVVNNPAAVNVNNEQSMPDIAALHNGGFVAVWYGVYDENNNNPYEIWGQRFSSAGAKDGGVFHVNTSTGFEGSYQDSPSVTTLSDGRFVVVWRSDSQDGASAGVFGQRFNADGSKDGAEFRANTYTAGGQYQQHVAALNDGGYVVVWGSDSAQDTSGWGVYGQRYDAAGAPVGGEFRVNYTVSGTQYQPAVAPLVNGGFVISWSNGDEIWLQQYDASGHKVDSEQAVNPKANYGYSATPELISTPDGGFITTYSGYNYDNSTYDIFLQRFSNSAPNVQDVSVIGPEDTPIVLTEALFAAGFSDPEGQALAAIKIVTLPASGTLKLNGVNVVPGQIIGVADLVANKLTYLGNLNFNGPDQFRWTGSDGNIFANGSVFTNITVNNVNDPPGLEAGVNGGAQEGVFFTRGITLSDPDVNDSHLITVSWDDGHGNTGSYQTNVGTNHNPSLGLTLPDDGTYTVTVKADDLQGQANSVETDNFVVTVANVAPTLGLGGNNTVEQGLLYTLTLGAVVDPGADTETGYVVDWGDGTTQPVSVAQLPANRQLTHTYASAANRTIAVSVTDEDGTFANAGTKSIVVTPPAEVIVVSAGADTSANEGTLFSRNVTFTDPADQDPAGRQVTVDWGDGTPVQNFNIAAGVFSFNISHVFADNRLAAFDVSVTVNDSGAQQASDNFLVTVNDVAPTIGIGGSGVVNEGSAYTITLGGVVDPGADTVSQYVIHWGDGVDQTVLAANVPANRQFVHVYADGNVGGTPRTVTVDLVNEDGTFPAAGQHALTVLNVAPVVPVSGANTTNEGATYTLTVGAVVDPGTDTPTLYRINWGDGSPVTEYSPAEYATLLAGGGTVNHVFADGGNGGTGRTITMQVLDEDGTHTAGTKSITVNNVAPSVVLTGNAASNEGASYTLNLVGSDPAGASDTLSYAINWGDGSPLQNLTAAQLAGLGGNVLHTYADDEDGPVNATARTIQVTVSDEDGGSSVNSMGVTVNNVAPTASISGADSVNEASLYTVTLGAVSDPGADTRTAYSIDWGDGSSTALTPAQYAAGSATHTYADGGNGGTLRTINVSATDEDGTFVLGSKSLTVNNVAPSVVLTGNAASNEGAAYTLNLAGSDPAGANDTLSYAINWGDGSPLQNLTAAQLAGLGGNVLHTYADDEDGPVNATPRTIQVTVSDDDGGSSLQSKVVTVNNVAPSIALGGAGNAQVGLAYTLNLGAVTDPGQDTVSSYIIDWGDGGAAQTVNNAGNVQHTYASTGNRTISVSLVDEDGTFANAGSLPVSVGAATPNVSLEAGPDANINEGSTFTRTIGFSDGQDNGAAGWSYSIDYGDGTVVPGTTLTQTLDLSHVYTDGNAARTVSVTVTDVPGESATDSFIVNVANVAPTASISGADSVNEASLYTVILGAVSDPGADTRTAYNIDWGDGSNTALTPAQYAAGSATHTYADGGNGGTPRTINVSATDEDGTFVLGSKSITVNNVAPSVVLTGNAASNEGASYTLNLVGSDPAGANDTLSYAINWGDGSPLQNLTAAQLAGLGGNVTHTYADDEDGPINATARTIQVTVSDEDGGSSLQSKVVTVNNVAPTASISGADSVNEASLYTVTLGAVSDPGADTRTAYSIDWGDGSSTALTPAQYAAGSATHTYADGGNGGTLRTINVSATDEDGTFVLGSKSLTVNNVAPSVVLTGNAASNEGAAYTLNLAGSDPAGANDTLSYAINWGDGSPLQNLTAAQLAGLGGNVLHTYADDEDGPVNATPRTIQVTVSDDDGGSSLQSKVVTVNNVAPSIALGGAGNAQVGLAYTLNLGAVTDPGQDTVSSYIIDWGDGGAAQTVNNAGNVQHTYASTGNRTISVSLVDEDGTFANAGSLPVSVGAATPNVSLEAGPDANINEGSTFTRTIGFSDGQDNGAAGWSYSIDYGDGTVVPGTTLTQTLDLSHVYTDGNAARTVSVTVTDVPGESATDSFIVNVANVAPTASISGADSVNEASLYTVILGAVSDPGADTRTAYSIDWGDGSNTALTPAQYAAGSATHTYADGGNGGTPRTINVSATDEDGTFVLGSKSITVNNVAPSVVLTGNAASNEGASYTLNLVGSDPAGANDTLSYAINWGDGSPLQNLTAAQLAGLGGNVLHTYADDEDGPVNATPRTIQVTVSDEDGGSSLQSKVVTVNNVAPTASISGADSVNEATIYTLNVGTITDPGTDTRSGYSIHWGDGSTDNFTPAQWANAGGSFSHTYADSVGDVGRTISLDLVDEDGTYLSVATKNITVKDVATPPAIIHLGDATGIVSGANPNVWAPFWTNPDVAISHKADYVSNIELWSPVTFNALAAGALAGGDLYGGDLGVSGQNLATSTIRQEIQGAEALRFDLVDPANKVTLNLSKFFQDDDGNLLNQNEAGRLQALDGSGNVVSELTFTANSADGRQMVTLALAGDSVFKTLVLSAGAYDDQHQFIFGAYVNDGGTTIDPYADLAGKLHGSDFLVHDIEFEVPVLGAPVVP